MARSTAQRVVSHVTHRRATNDFLQFARNIAIREGWSEYEVYTRWSTAAACALLNPVWRAARDKGRWDENEEQYMRVVASCRHKRETMEDMTRMPSHAALALEESPRDFLGPVFMEFCASELHGQFFTPDEVSELNAAITLTNARDALRHAYAMKGRTWLTLSEPACGVGGMVLAANRVLARAGFDTGTEARWTCVDVDRRAVEGAFIQLSLTGAHAVVIHGNTLTMEERDVMPTLQAVLNPAPKTAKVMKLIAPEGLSGRIPEDAISGSQAKKG